MSVLSAATPFCRAATGSVAVRIESRQKDLGGFTVRRVLPSPDIQMVGPFIFFDQMGPASFAPGEGIQVRPHPHIGIATVTYLFEGEIIHRDSLGFVQPIRPGAVNVMTAGRGIVHSERAGDDLRSESRLHGIQSWMALPTGDQESEPAFAHYPADGLPTFDQNGCRVRVIIGEVDGQCSPVPAPSTMLYAEYLLPQGSSSSLPDQYHERAAYVVSGAVQIDGERYRAGIMAVAKIGAHVRVEALEDSRVMLIGGDPVGERHIWWNFVASSAERIERAKRDWREGRFAAVPGDREFIPLPD